jgi:hypothetical protein
MAGRMLIVLLTLALVVTPTHAQTGKVLLDMTILTLPGIPSGHCLSVDAGRFVVEAHLMGENRWPVRFILGPALNVPASLDLQVNTPGPASSTAQVEAGVYCYALTNEAITEAQGLPDEASQWEQPVAVRLIWLPAP